MEHVQNETTGEQNEEIGWHAQQANDLNVYIFIRIFFIIPTLAWKSCYFSLKAMLFIFM